jgi:hypothetical protein
MMTPQGAHEEGTDSLSSTISLTVNPQPACYIMLCAHMSGGHTGWDAAEGDGEVWIVKKRNKKNASINVHPGVCTSVDSSKSSSPRLIQ